MGGLGRGEAPGWGEGSPPSEPAAQEHVGSFVPSSCNLRPKTTCPPSRGGKPALGDSPLSLPAGPGAAAAAEAAGSGAGRPGGCEGAAGRGGGPTPPGAGWPLPGLCGAGEPGVRLSATAPPGRAWTRGQWDPSRSFTPLVLSGWLSLVFINMFYLCVLLIFPRAAPSDVDTFRVWRHFIGTGSRHRGALGGGLPSLRSRGFADSQGLYFTS